MKIFIELPTWLGDAVMATPAIENIVRHYPECELIIFGSFLSTQLFLDHPNVKEIVVDKSRSEGNRYLNLYKQAREIGKIDIAISFRSSFSTKFLFWFLDASQKCIYRKDKHIEKHQVLRYNDLINSCLGLQTTPGTLKIYQRKVLSKKSDRKTLGINPGATYGSAKRWYPEKFAEVAIVLSDRYDIVIFGGPNETDIAVDIEEELRKSGVQNYMNLAGKTTIPELIDRISQLDLFITGDSGPMHVAAAFQVSTVALFGPTKDKETSQWKNPKGIIVKKEMACAPCMKRTCPLKHHECMKFIKAEDVLKAVKQLT
ncbi:ADP-heptose--LPS heptosyltransferase [Sulfurovum lithotrophicum]|uniref:lipopolysaccharide heptosyltransferase II n=1 Tax=Sulfurovum lithotrophicum TaxID=206403 RepID=A0A7U4M027_9BACT|nr:lipopolysaccharide heptosyltransferase II [Sulfurovum lithotrophicum]AKF24347.1 ADP-heptose--LPS heptosyltransferase [Sulfurovum lithotrophicum]